MGIHFFNVAAAGNASSVSEIATLIEDEGAVVGQATAQRGGILAVTQLQRGVLSHQRIAAVSDIARQD